jgi:hypothetical protein
MQDDSRTTFTKPTRLECMMQARADTLPASTTLWRPCERFWRVFLDEGVQGMCCGGAAKWSPLYIYMYIYYRYYMYIYEARACCEHSIAACWVYAHGMHASFW